jgi:signal transduction histidine kinase
LSLSGLILSIKVLLNKNERLLLQRERARIARDIHDDIGTRMTQLVLQGEVAQAGLTSNSKTRLQLDRMSEEARETLQAMDEILWAINPRRDTLQEFATFVCGHAQRFLKATSIQCLLDVEPGTSNVAFDLPFRRNLLMAVKEALNNAAKHSGATELHLQIHRRGHGLAVVVRDNGRGFDATPAQSNRNGVDNMRQRMAEIGGTCKIVSRPGEGCRIEFYIPIIQMRQRRWWSKWQLPPDNPTSHPLISQLKDEHVEAS